MADSVGLLYLGSDGKWYAVQSTGTGNGGLPVSVLSLPATVQKVDIEQVLGSPVITGGVTGSLAVGGTSASGATDDASNPVKIAGIYTTSPPTLTTGQRGAVQLTSRSALATGIADPTSGSFAGVVSGADGQSNANLGLQAYSRPSWFNATSWDRAVSITGALTTGVGNLAIQQAPSSAAAAGVNTGGTSSLASSFTFKSSAGNLYYINFIATTAAGFFMLFNATTAPADGAVAPVLCYPIAAAGAASLQFDPPIHFSVGITAVFSTTGPLTKTASATAVFLGGAL